MNEEMFMKLLEMVQQAGEGGYALALIYLFYDYFSAILIAGTIIAVVVLVVRTVRSFARVDGVLRDVAGLVGESWYGELTAREGGRIIEAVKQQIADKGN